MKTTRALHHLIPRGTINYYNSANHFQLVELTKTYHIELCDQTNTFLNTCIILITIINHLNEWNILPMKFHHYSFSIFLNPKLFLPKFTFSDSEPILFKSFFLPKLANLIFQLFLYLQNIFSKSSRLFLTTKAFVSEFSYFIFMLTQ